MIYFPSTKARQISKTITGKMSTHKLTSMPVLRLFIQITAYFTIKLPLALTAVIITMRVSAQTPELPPPAYFPTHKDGKKGGGISELEAGWYGKSLLRMTEPSLWPAPKGTVCMRFLILPTWGNPISVRATLEGERYRLVGRRLSGQGGYDPGKLAENKEVFLNREQSKRLTELMEDAKIFEMAETDSVFGCDGDQWIVETVRNQKYRIAVRWTAGHDTAKRGLTEFVRFCDFLITSSTLTQRPINKGHEIIPKSK